MTAPAPAERMAALEAELVADYATLHLVEQAGTLRIRGSFPVKVGEQVLTWFRVEIALPAEFPHALPIVWETGGRIPRVPERHINTADGSACVVLPDAFWMSQDRAEVSLLEFLRGPVHNFFLGQALVETGQPWPFGEWAHGASGVREHYAALLGTSAPEAPAQLLRFALQQVKGHRSCPCGSGRRLRKCHGDLLRRIRQRVPADALRQALQRINTGK